MEFQPPVIHKCNDCGREIAVVNNGSDHIIALNCPDCWDKYKKTKGVDGKAI